MEWETVIGLEIHVQLLTKSKIFSAASTAYGAQPNTQADDVSIALPGVLPVMNREAARLAVRFGLGIGARINKRSIFARKNYFYPDLPKGYQISQYELPIVGKGRIEIETSDGCKMIGITRAHLEEDAGKSLHEDFHDMTGIDFNRAGVPLLEIVSEPDLRSAAEAVAYLRKIHSLVRYLDISDGNMQEGSLRCDANVSMRARGEKKLGTRTELKNINSFRFVEKAIEFEIDRQIGILEDGGEIVQETRLYDSDKNETRSMRSKEEAHDYRYFPDPDLPEMILDDEFIEQIRNQLPELPDARKSRLEREYHLSSIDAAHLTRDRDTADYFENVCAQTSADAKTVANWMLGELSAALNHAALEISDSPVDSVRLANLLDRINDDTISGKIAKQIFTLLWESGNSVDQVINDHGLKQITDTGAIEAIVDNILRENSAQVSQYKAGNQKIFGFFVGQVMKQSGGKANPKQVNDLLRNKLD
ncbi:Asp-tRNA(Asn)/Glu-tRNA(Gln) amidotransferase subunit GatB [Candidatus Spongiihabitans sp.]|uniref:Asp-tRNA(Asn)/Glu-tRNA(Gln) amidotransferase subunit GatB n=1 Tax=Candidatus Spongiihabitans sp. TaxID=3101308 RepID=UPI003C7D55B2